MTSQRIKSLLDIHSFQDTVNRVLTAFTCTEDQLRTCIARELDAGLVHDMESWVLELPREECINLIIQLDAEYSWWNSVGTGKAKNMRAIFEKRVVTTMATSILIAAISMMEDMTFVLDPAIVRDFIIGIEQAYKVNCLKDLVPYIKRLR